MASATPENASARAAETWRLDIVEQVWKAAAAAAGMVVACLRRRRATIQVSDVSEEWLTSHAAETPKHADDD